MNNRCALCGQFMSDDDVLLGLTEETTGRYAHAKCAQRYVERGDAVKTEHGITLREDPPRADDWQNAMGYRWL